MNPTLRLALLVGCVAIAAMVSPTSARVLTEDLLGPRALRPEVAQGCAVVRPDLAIREISSEAPEEIARMALDSEQHHDAP